jgi:hypothetical protein
MQMADAPTLLTMHLEGPLLSALSEMAPDEPIFIGRIRIDAGELVEMLTEPAREERDRERRLLAEATDTCAAPERARTDSGMLRPDRLTTVEAEIIGLLHKIRNKMMDLDMGPATLDCLYHLQGLEALVASRVVHRIEPGMFDP